MTEYNLSDWNLQDLSIIMHLPYTYRISRINISSVIGCALLSPFCSNFVLGNIQNFLDSSQIIILQLLIVVGILLFLVAAFALLFELNYSIYLRKLHYVGSCIISGIACLLGLIIAILAAIILLLANGLT